MIMYNKIILYTIKNLVLYIFIFFNNYHTEFTLDYYLYGNIRKIRYLYNNIFFLFIYYLNDSFMLLLFFIYY